MDPAFTRIDLFDCQYGILRKYVTADWAKMVTPSSVHKDIDKILPPPPQPQPLDPSVENANSLKGVPLIAFRNQNQMAHIDAEKNCLKQKKKLKVI